MTERYVSDMKATGLEPNEIIECFFDYLKEAFHEEADIAVAMMSEETLH